MSFQILQRAYAPYDTAAQFPASGDSRLIYRATDTWYLYTWDASESAYKLAGIDPATAPYLGLHAQADDAARLGGQLPSYYAQASHVHTFAGLTSKPTTLAGYGITDAAAASHVHSGYETAIGNPSADGYLLSSTSAGVRSWVAPYSHPANHAALTGVLPDSGSQYHLTQTQHTSLTAFGPYTVANLAALGAGERPAFPVYCSDCISPNGTGAMVQFDIGSSAWRLTCCGIVATTSWTEYCLDSLTYGISRVHGAKLSCERTFLEGGNVGTLSYSGTGAVADITFGNGFAFRRFLTGTTATGYAKTAYTQRIARLASGYRFAIGLVGVSLLDNLTGAFLLFGVSPTAPTASRQTLPAYFIGFALDPGNAAGALNAGLSTNWLTVNRENSVNLTGTGATSIAPELYTGSPQNLLIVSDGPTLYLYINSTLVQTMTAATNNSAYIWLQLTNNGTATTAKTSYSKTLMSLVQISQ